MSRPGLAPLPGNVIPRILPAADAVAAFQARGLLTPTFSWQDLWNGEHAHRFTVAKLFRDDLLGEIYRQLGLVLTDGKTLKDFQAALIPKLKEAGWWGKNVKVVDPVTGEIGRTTVDPARLALIYDINTRQAYAAGRWARAMRGPMPYLIYRTKGDERVRASHRRWDFICLPKNDPWWDTHYPPNGWRCRCLAYAIDEAGIKNLEAAGFKILRQAPDDGPPIPFTNKRTGEITQVPWGIDPGFAYNPGKAAEQRLGQMVLEKEAALPPAIAVRAVREYLTQPQALGALTGEFATWAEAIQRPAGEMRHIGAIAPEVLEAMTTLGVVPESAVISVRDEDVLHAHRDAKDSALPWDWFRELPAHLVAPKAVLLDRSKATPALLYVWDIAGEAGKAVLLIDYEVQTRDATGAKTRQRVNILRSGRILNPAALGDVKTYQLLAGAL